MARGIFRNERYFIPIYRRFTFPATVISAYRDITANLFNVSLAVAGSTPRVFTKLKGYHMGSRGPSRTPSEILKLRGSWLPDSRGAEPKAETATAKSLRCPARLPPIGNFTWKKLLKQLD